MAATVFTIYKLSDSIISLQPPPLILHLFYTVLYLEGWTLFTAWIRFSFCICVCWLYIISFCIYILYAGYLLYVNRRTRVFQEVDTQAFTLGRSTTVVQV